MGALLFLSLLCSAHIWVLIYREAAERGNGGWNREVQRYRNASVAEMGEGRSPSPIFLMLNLFDVEGLCCPSMLPFYRGSLGRFYRFFGVFLGVLNFFQRTFEVLILC